MVESYGSRVLTGEYGIIQEYFPRQNIKDLHTLLYHHNLRRVCHSSFKLESRGVRRLGLFLCYHYTCTTQNRVKVVFRICPEILTRRFCLTKMLLHFARPGIPSN